MIEGWKNKTLPASKSFKLSPCIHTRDGRIPFYHSLEMDDYHQILKKPKRLKNELLGSQYLNGELYKRGFSQPYLRCIEEDEARYVLKEVHEGICGDHMGQKSLMRKIMRVGYFWPTMQQDAAEFVKRCDSCQRYGNVQ